MVSFSGICPGLEVRDNKFARDFILIIIIILLFFLFIYLLLQEVA